ncbi:hypothetical protein HDU67_005784, partial [Dinochytrium kinnereticum]
MPHPSTLSLLNLPTELLTRILLQTNDLSLSIKLECLHINLPAHRPNPSKAFEGLHITLFPVSNTLSHLPNAIQPTIKQSNPSLLVTSWIYHYHPHEWKPSWIFHASRTGSLSIIRLLHEKGCQEFTPGVMDEAASKGHLRVVEYLHRNRCEGCTVIAMNNAARNGHLEVVRFLRVHRREGNVGQALRLAELWGKMEVVEYLRGQ